jgi:hypothetical protein
VVVVVVVVGGNRSGGSSRGSRWLVGLKFNPISILLRIKNRLTDFLLKNTQKSSKNRIFDNKNKEKNGKNFLFFTL